MHVCGTGSATPSGSCATTSTRDRTSTASGHATVSLVLTWEHSISQAAGVEVEQARGVSSAEVGSTHHLAESARCQEHLLHSAGDRDAEGLAAAVEGGASGNVAEDDCTESVRRQLVAAADLAAAQLARELDDALRRHVASLEARAMLTSTSQSWWSPAHAMLMTHPAP